MKDLEEILNRLRIFHLYFSLLPYLEEKREREMTDRTENLSVRTQRHGTQLKLQLVPTTTLKNKSRLVIKENINC